jgi:hypothetical protein
VKAGTNGGVGVTEGGCVSVSVRVRVRCAAVVSVACLWGHVAKHHCRRYGAF